MCSDGVVGFNFHFRDKWKIYNNENGWQDEIYYKSEIVCCCEFFTHLLFDGWFVERRLVFYSDSIWNWKSWCENCTAKEIGHWSTFYLCTKRILPKSSTWEQETILLNIEKLSSYHFGKSPDEKSNCEQFVLCYHSIYFLLFVKPFLRKQQQKAKPTNVH